jgi:hypothetical protein
MFVINCGRHNTHEKWGQFSEQNIYFVPRTYKIRIIKIKNSQKECKCILYKHTSFSTQNAIRWNETAIPHNTKRSATINKGKNLTDLKVIPATSRERVRPSEVKVKLSRYRPEQAHGRSSRLRPRIFLTFGTRRSSALRTGRLYSQEFYWYSFLEAESNPGHMVAGCIISFRFIRTNHEN